MERTRQQIFDLALASIQQQALLGGLSFSPVARWLWIISVMADLMHDQEVYWANLKAEVERIRDDSVPGTLSWYRDQAFKWQNGHLLELIDGRPGYPADSPADRLVAVASASEDGIGTIVIKAAKDTGGQLGPLSAPEEQSLRGYYERIRFAGTRTSIISLNPGTLVVQATIHYEALATEADVALQVEEAITGFLDNLPFDGTIQRIRLIDAIQEVAPVVDVELLQLTANDGAGAFSVGRLYRPLAGYVIIDPNQPLSATLNFSPS